jgi:hypothetical protein
VSFEVLAVITVKISVLQNVILTVRKLSRNSLPPSSFTLKMEATMPVNIYRTACRRNPVYSDLAVKQMSLNKLTD